MPVPPPAGDMYNRLLVLSEILDQAVAEVQRAIDDAKRSGPPHGPEHPDTQAGSTNDH